MWTCCGSLDPDALGCVQTQHSDEMLHCVGCGRWIKQSHWGVEKCWCHPGKPEQFSKWGGLRWDCCGKQGTKNSKYSKLGDDSPMVDVPEAIDRMVRWQDGLRPHLATAIRKPLSRPKNAKRDAIGIRWAVNCAQRKPLTLTEIMNRDGCQLGVHMHSFKPRCVHCDTLLIPEALDRDGFPVDIDPEAPRHAKPTTMCPNCATENRICTQCETVVPALVVLPQEWEPPQPEHPPASYHHPYEGGAPPPPPRPPPRPSLGEGMPDPLEHSICRFHPGVWDTTRKTRFAFRQPAPRKPPPQTVSTESLRGGDNASEATIVEAAAAEIIPPTSPPPPSRPESAATLPPESPPPTAHVESPRRIVSTAFQTDERPLMISRQTGPEGMVRNVGCQQDMPVGEATQTGEIGVRWCKHTTRNRDAPSQSVVIRKWKLLPQSFVIPGDRYDETDHFANGGHGVQQRAPSHLREVMDAKRTKGHRIVDFLGRHLSTESGRELDWAFKEWSRYSHERLEHLGELLPAAYRLASMQRWREVLAPPPSGSRLPRNFRQCGSVAKGLASKSAMQQVGLLHALSVWVANAAIDRAKMRGELMWFGHRMKSGGVHAAFERWFEHCMGERRALVLTGLRSLADEGNSPLPFKPRPENAVDSSAQTERSFDFMTDTERRGKIHWRPLTMDSGMQTMDPSEESGPVWNVREPPVDKACQHLEGEEPPKYVASGAQTDFDAVYGNIDSVLIWKGRRGSAAENKVEGYRQACPEEKALKAMREAGARAARRRAEAKANEAKEQLRLESLRDTSMVTWAYTETAPEVVHKTRRIKEAKSAQSLYDQNGRPVAQQTASSSSLRSLSPDAVRFAPLSEAEKRALKEAEAATVMQNFAAILRAHKTRVIDLFRALDRNSDGQVSQKELMGALSSLGVTASDSEIEGLFGELDRDGSGDIEFKELQKALRIANQQLDEAEAKAKAAEAAAAEEAAAEAEALLADFAEDDSSSGLMAELEGLMKVGSSSSSSPSTVGL